MNQNSWWKKKKFKAQFFKESFLNREKTYRAEPSFKK